ncbi:MAG: universal stress protein [Polyangiaceae bacterium]
MNVKRILVPTDFSTMSARALDYATGLAEPFQGEVVLLHVCEPRLAIQEQPPFSKPAESDEVVQEEAQRHLEQIIAPRAQTTVHYHPVVRTGDVLLRIEEVAKEIGADLICMGTHGRTGLQRALLGSVAERVVRTSHFPVLTLGPEAKAA